MSVTSESHTPECGLHKQLSPLLFLASSQSGARSFFTGNSCGISFCIFRQFLPFSIPLLPERLLCIARQWNISEIITDQRLGFEVVRIFCAHFILGFHVQLPADFLGCLFKGNPFLGDDGGDTDEVVAFRVSRFSSPQRIQGGVYPDPRTLRNRRSRNSRHRNCRGPTG